MKIVILCLCLTFAGCTSLVPSGSSKRPQLTYDEAYTKADSYVKQHDVTWAGLIKTTQDDDAFFFHYSLEHKNVADVFQRIVRVDKSSGRVKVMNDFR